MGFELSVQLKGLNDKIIPAWLAEIRKFNMDVDIYPNFSFNNHSGFLPFKIVTYDCPNRSLNNIELLTGYELFVNRIEESIKRQSLFTKLFSGQKQLSPIEKKLSEADTEVIFKISARDSFEFRIGWYSAASLALLCDGVLTDLYEGVQLEGQEMIRRAHEVVLEDERLIKENEWRVHEFKEWLG
ncbi:hypothetical protein [Paenibacillus chitinolyticus]|nr:hypothetical protein [Paenibacillus chitinolyticus]MCY9593959.1 hypothetical protein [Paenibacillus chitinolyticus]MCY9599512.1 hypothetical protein [Paenibacillus chitinolyticus]